MALVLPTDGLNDLVETVQEAGAIPVLERGRPSCQRSEIAQMRHQFTGGKGFADVLFGPVTGIVVSATSSGSPLLANTFSEFSSLL